MLFKITSLDKEKNTVVQYYDNVTQFVYNDQHERELFEDPKYNDMKCEKKVVGNRKIESISTDLNYLKIQFGLNCNFHCKYCNQRHDRELDKHVKLGDYNLIVDNLINKFAEKNIKCKHITLWGGEPLVYFKLLKVLVPRLIQHFGKDVKINTISNGSLLNDEVVDFIIENDMGLTISHDGPSFNVYRDDKNPLDNPVVVRSLQRLYDHYEQPEQKKNRYVGLSINVVVTPENCDITEMQSYFESKIGRPVKFHFEGIVKCDKYSDSIITKFNKHTKNILTNSVFVAGISDPAGPFWALRSKISRFMGDVINGVDMTNFGFGCDTNSRTAMSVDIAGNILACHGSSAENTKIGTLDDLPGVKNFRAIPYQQRKSCTDCPVLALCKGGCPIVDDEDHAIACKNLKLWYSAQFAAAWYNMFGLILQRIEPCR